MNADGSRQGADVPSSAGRKLLAAFVPRRGRSNVSATPTRGTSRYKDARAVVAGGLSAAHLVAQTPEPWLLITDGCASLADVEDPLKQVTVITYPANSTGVHQPADARIIAVLTVQYRGRLLKIRVSTMCIT